MATQQVARPHTHLSNRTKVRSALERKPVFKGVLENPFHISWPSLSANLQNVALARLVAVLGNIPSRHRASGKSLQKSETVSQRHTIDIAEEVAPANISSDKPDRVAPPRLIIGINAVTRALESQLHLSRKRVVVDNPLGRDADSNQLLRPAPSSVAVVFVCQADVDPPALVDHIPYLVAGCNSPRNVMQTIKLVPLPKHSEPIISEILAIRRAAVVAFPRGSFSEAIQDILESVPTLSAPWLCTLNAQDPQLVPTHTKQLRTTAPKDMKSAREQRSKARTEARKKSTASSRSVHRKPRVKLTTA